MKQIHLAKLAGTAVLALVVGCNSSSNIDESGATVSLVSTGLWSHTETEYTNGHTYAEVYTEPSIIMIGIEKHESGDFFQNGLNDVLITMSRGHASGLENLMTPVALRNTGQGFEVATDELGLIPYSGARRVELLTAEKDTLSWFSVNHDTADGLYSDATYIRFGDNPGLATNTLPVLPHSQPGNPLAQQFPNRRHVVSAHAMAAGDITGNGYSDVLISDLGSFDDTGVGGHTLILRQTADGVFELDENDTFFNDMHFHPIGEQWFGRWPREMHLTDLTGNGVDDLVVSWHKHYKDDPRADTVIFYNDGYGNFDVNDHQILPDGIYGELGSNNFIVSADFFNNGHNDLMMVYTVSDPDNIEELYYSGYHMQMLINDGTGNMIESDNHYFKHIPGNITEYSTRFNNTENFKFMDINQNGYLDLIGSDWRVGTRVWMNTGEIFEEIQVNNDLSNDYWGSAVIAFVENDKKNSVDLIHPRYNWSPNQENAESVTMTLDHLQLNIK